MTSTGEFAGPGVVGEIVLRGGFMHSYWDKPDKTAQTIRNGWLHSGDLGVLDADGFLTMRGRRNELIQVAGKDWFPRDVEEALGRQPGVALAALIGVAERGVGMRPIAFITTEPGHRCEPNALKTAIAREVTYDLSPLEIVVAQSLPMTATGKISKAELAEQAAGKLATGG